MPGACSSVGGPSTLIFTPGNTEAIGRRVPKLAYTRFLPIVMRFCTAAGFLMFVSPMKRISSASNFGT